AQSAKLSVGRWMLSVECWALIGSQGLLRLFLAEFLKARIVAHLIPHLIESQRRRSKKHRTPVWYLEQPLENGNRVVGIAQQRVDARHILLFGGALEWIFG